MTWHERHGLGSKMMISEASVQPVRSRFVMAWPVAPTQLHHAHRPIRLRQLPLHSRRLAMLRRGGGPVRLAHRARTVCQCRAAGSGVRRIARHLASLARPNSALCACELRSPAPFAEDGFRAFNAICIQTLE